MTAAIPHAKEKFVTRTPAHAERVLHEHMRRRVRMPTLSRAEGPERRPEPKEAKTPRAHAARVTRGAREPHSRKKKTQRWAQTRGRCVASATAGYNISARSQLARRECKLSTLAARTRGAHPDGTGIGTSHFPLGCWAQEKNTKMGANAWTMCRVRICSLALNRTLAPRTGSASKHARSSHAARGAHPGGTGLGRLRTAAASSHFPLGCWAPPRAWTMRAPRVNGSMARV